MKIHLQATLMAFMLFSAAAKATNPDSLLATLELPGLHDTLKVKNYLQAIGIIVQADPQKGRDMLYAQRPFMAAMQRPDSVHFFSHLGFSFGRQSVWDSAAHYWHKAHDICDKTKQPSQYGKLCSNLGTFYAAMGQMDKAREYKMEAIASLRATNDPSLGASLTSLAIFYYTTGDFLEAAKTCLEALEVNTQPAMEPSIYHTLGTIYEELGDLPKARQYGKQAVAAWEAAKDTIPLITGYTTLALNYCKMPDPDSVAFLIDKLDFIYTTKQISDRSGVFLVKGKWHLIQEKPDSAIHYLNLAEKADPGTYVRFTALVKESLANAHFAKGNYPATLDYFQQFLSIADQHKLLGDVPNAHRGLASVYQATGNTQKALYHLQQYVELNEKIRNQRNLQQISILEAEHQYEQEKLLREQELASAKLAQKFSEQNSFRQRILIGGLAAALLAAGFFYFQLNRKNKTVTEQNGLIEKALKEKDLLLREIHHRVKNNLQTISSILSLQGRKVSDHQAKTALAESQNRINSISLVHSFLYNKENLTGVNVRQYIQSLAGQLLDFYKPVNDEVALSVDVPDKHYDISLMAPIGLVVNELVTNVFKHAFQPDRQENKNLGIQMAENGEYLELTVKDNGNGIPGPDGQTYQGGFGFVFLQDFAQKFNGDLLIDGQNGTAVTLRIPAAAFDFSKNNP